MIPKTIHYCWFGRNPKPKLAKKCIRSWLRFCPDYKIIEWNEDNFDISKAPLYVRQAYDSKKWAFVTDYVRLWAMTEYGGIYMDTDVQVLKPLDRFLQNHAFSGFENETSIPTGIMACEKGFPLFKQFLSYYDNAEFIHKDGSINQQTNVTTITNICVEKGLLQNNSLQTIEGFTIYPKSFFCPISYTTGFLEKTDDTVTIHWFAGSWHSKEEKQRRKENQHKARRVETIHFITHFPNRMLMLLLGEDRYNFIKKVIKKK